MLEVGGELVGLLAFGLVGVVVASGEVDEAGEFGFLFGEQLGADLVVVVQAW